MPKRLSQNVKDNIEKCRSLALAAVEAYNSPGRRFRTAQYIVMIIIAWSALFHAIFFQRRRRPWYRKKTSGTGKGVRYLRVDGEPKYWELSECLKQYFGDNNPPERKNLEFLIGLRNKIEHRHIPELDASLYGECQAALLNLEEVIAREFGQKYVLTEELAISLQFSRQIPSEKRRVTKILASTTARNIKEYIEKFRGDLSYPVLNSMKYSFNVFLVPRVANRSKAADAAIQFVHIDEANEEEFDRLEKLNVLIKEKHIPIVNLDLYKPGQVVQKLIDKIPYQMNMAMHTDAWRHYKVRPSSNADDPKKTRSEYCLYDKAHGDYLYTQAWVDMLAVELSSAEGFVAVTGRKPLQKLS
ncbi:MAG: DUF3644 domain-containing protein [Proteobacteria bacterium]|nr:DUF3644 domain-containing protein [Pseudomonadota bacterium]